MARRLSRAKFSRPRTSRVPTRRPERSSLIPPRRNPTDLAGGGRTPAILFVIACLLAFPLALLPGTSSATAATPVSPFSRPFSYPIGMHGEPLGDGFFIRDAYAAENTWYNPGYWHTGEDWYRQEGSTAGAAVYAIAAGQVVYADADYPGRVVIVRHAPDLYSMYGHLDPALRVTVGQQVSRGQLLGTVLDRHDGVPSHLHFEVRTFLETADVNGAAPRYGFKCGVDCPPGPGYWPITAPDHPSDLGWRNPTQVIAHRAYAASGATILGTVVVADHPASATTSLWSAPAGSDNAHTTAEHALRPGTSYALLAVHAGPEASRGTSAAAYDLWYRIRLGDGRDGWVQAAVPTDFDAGSDGRPSSVVFDFFPAVIAA